MEIDHGWRVKTANSSTKELYGACPDINVVIGATFLRSKAFLLSHNSWTIVHHVLPCGHEMPCSKRDF